MSKTKEPLHFKLKPSKDGFKAFPHPKTREYFQKKFDKGVKDIYLQPITEKKARSLQELKWYRGFALPTMASNIDFLSKFAIPLDNGKFDYDPLHRFLITKWAIENNRHDLIKIYPMWIKGQLVEEPQVFMAFDKMKHEDVQLYKRWLDTKLVMHTGHGFETWEAKIKEQV